jgi:hypothetical protein
MIGITNGDLHNDTGGGYAGSGARQCVSPDIIYGLIPRQLETGTRLPVAVVNSRSCHSLIPDFEPLNMY